MSPKTPGQQQVTTKFPTSGQAGNWTLDQRGRRRVSIFSGTQNAGTSGKTTMTTNANGRTNQIKMPW